MGVGLGDEDGTILDIRLLKVVGLVVRVGNAVTLEFLLTGNFTNSAHKILIYEYLEGLGD